MKKTASILALAATLPLAMTTMAAAQDPEGKAHVHGKFGVGGLVDSNGMSGLNFRYWISDFGLQGTVGMDYTGKNGLIDSQFGLGLSLRGLYNFARANDTNMYIGAGVSLGLIDFDRTLIDVVLGVEHFFTHHFSVGGQVGFHLDVGSDPIGFTLGNNASWGTAFTFYF